MAYQILCIDDDPRFLLGIKATLKKKYRVSTAADFQKGLEILKAESIDLVFLDVSLGDEDGIQILKKIKSDFETIDVVMLSGHRDPDVIVEAMKEGACDYLCKPHPAEELVAIVEKNRKNKDVRDRYEALIEDMNESKEVSDFIGKSAEFHEVMDRAAKLKGFDANVLIEGESGTGKELLAKFIHNQEGNPKRPFIAVNCAAIPDNLIESELFGHEQGSFTGASKRKIGKFELAGGGDIFLDEINSLKLELQAKLLRVLQEKEFYRVGGTQPIHVNFRVIAATNANLNDQVSNGNFRQDLLYRLRVISLTLPTLRHRLEDLPELVDYFLKKHSKAGEIKIITPGVYDRFSSYNWPGNIRELENLLQSLIIMSKGHEITVNDLPIWLNKTETVSTQYEKTPELKYDTIRDSLKDYMTKAEKDYVKYVLKAKGGNMSKAAEVLRVSRSKLYYTLKGEELN